MERRRKGLKVHRQYIHKRLRTNPPVHPFVLGQKWVSSTWGDAVEKGGGECVAYWGKRLGGEFGKKGDIVMKGMRAKTVRKNGGWGGGES